MKKILTIICVAFFIIGTATVTSSLQPKNASGHEVVYEEQEETLGLAAFDHVPVYCTNSGSAATSTYQYFTADEASSTCIFLIEGAERVDLKWILNASSTSSVINYAVYFADENGGKTWYPEKNFTATDDSVIYGAGDLIRSIPPALSGVSYHNTDIQDLTDRWIKVEYTLTGANGGLYLKAETKNIASN